MKIIGYDIISADDPNQLSYAVRESIKHGWQPYGPVNVISTEMINGGNTHQYCQTVVQYENKVNPIAGALIPPHERGGGL